MTKTPSKFQIDRVRRQNARDAKNASVNLNAPAKPGDAAKLNASVKARNVLRKMQAKRRAGVATSGLKKSDWRRDNRKASEGPVKRKDEFERVRDWKRNTGIAYDRLADSTESKKKADRRTAHYLTKAKVAAHGGRQNSGTVADDPARAEMEYRGALKKGKKVY